jgi:hypothetical protein
MTTEPTTAEPPAESPPTNRAIGRAFGATLKEAGDALSEFLGGVAEPFERPPLTRRQRVMAWFVEVWTLLKELVEGALPIVWLFAGLCVMAAALRVLVTP